MSKTAKFAMWIMLGTILSKVLGFGRELVLANFYGASDITDAFLVAVNIPNIAIATIGSALATTYVPLYFEIKNKHGEDRTNNFTNNILNIVIIFSIIICILGLIFTEPLVKLFAIGFEGEKLNIAINFTKVLIFGSIFLSLAKIFSSYLQVNDNFTIASLIGSPYNIIIIISIVLSYKINISILAYGTLLAMASQMLFQLPFAYKCGYRYVKSINLKDEYIKKMIYLIGPVFIGVAVNQLNIMIDRTLASTIGSGAISTLNYANRLNDFVVSLFVLSIITVIYPKLAKVADLNNKDKFVDTLVSTCNSIVLLVMPITVGTICLATPIVRLLFQRGAFDENATKMTSIALILYSIGLVAIGLREILTRTFYSLSDTKTPMINGSIAILINILLNLIFIRILGYAGLALATSISTIIGVILLSKSLKKKIKYFGGDLIIKTAIKSFIASIVMGIITTTTYNLISNLVGIGFIQNIISVGLSIIIGIISYGLIIYTMKVREINIAINSIKNKIRKFI